MTSLRAKKTNKIGWEEGKSLFLAPRKKRVENEQVSAKLQVYEKLSKVYRSHGRYVHVLEKKRLEYEKLKQEHEYYDRMDENEKELRLEKEKDNLVKKMEEVQKAIHRCEKRMEKKQQEARDLAPY